MLHPRTLIKDDLTKQAALDGSLIIHLLTL